VCAVQRSDQRHVGLEKQFEIFKEYIQTVLNLSAGSLVLSITFLHDVVGLGSEGRAGTITVRHPGILGIAWLDFSFRSPDAFAIYTSWRYSRRMEWIARPSWSWGTSWAWRALAWD